MLMLCLLCGYVCRSEKERILLYLQTFNTKLCSFKTLNLGFISKIFLKFRKFQLWYSYKMYKRKDVFRILMSKCTVFKISQIILAFWLEDRRIDVVLNFLFYSLFLTDRFHVAVRLYNRSLKTSKCGKNISDPLGLASWATFLFLPHLDVICYLLLNGHALT